MTGDPTQRPPGTPPAVTARQAPETPTDPRLDEIWQAEHRHLAGLASRMLGDPAGAEDVVQEAFGRLVQVDLDEIHDVRGWLTVVVRRLCLNRISSAYARRESAAGAAPPDRGLPLPGLLGQGTSGDPADRVTLDDQVQHALAVILDRLTPAERTSFVLHDVFGFPFTAIGEIVGRSPTACRQLASRARRTVRASAPDAQTDVASIDLGTTAKADAHRTLVDRFIAACSGGDVAGLVEILDPDVVGEATMLGRGPLGGFEGAHGVATGAMVFVGPESGATLLPFPLEGKPGILAIVHGRVQSIIRFDQAGGIIHHIHAFVIPPAVFRT